MITLTITPVDVVAVHADEPSSTPIVLDVDLFLVEYTDEKGTRPVGFLPAEAVEQFTDEARFAAGLLGLDLLIDRADQLIKA